MKSYLILNLRSSVSIFNDSDNQKGKGALLGRPWFVRNWTYGDSIATVLLICLEGLQETWGEILAAQYFLYVHFLLVLLVFFSPFFLRIIMIELNFRQHIVY